MKKFLVATDIHGSAYWMEKVKKAFDDSGADFLVLLGDVYNHGPRNPFPSEYAPMKVAGILQTLCDKLIVVKGNCDSEVDTLISPFVFAENNQFFAFDRRFLFTHGHVFNKDNIPTFLKKGDVMFYGHFHKTEVFVSGEGVIAVCVGSASLPKDRNCYAVVSENAVSFCDLETQEEFDRFNLR